MTSYFYRTRLETWDTGAWNESPGGIPQGHTVSDSGGSRSDWVPNASRSYVEGKLCFVFTSSMMIILHTTLNSTSTV